MKTGSPHDKYNGKYCKDCKHFKKRFWEDTSKGKCVAAKSIVFNSVDGPSEYLPYAHYCRDGDYNCGEQGKLWEKKDA